MEHIGIDDKGNNIFKCPICEKMVIRELKNGKRAKSCKNCIKKGRLVQEYGVIRKIGASYMVSVSKEVKNNNFKVGDKVIVSMRHCEDGNRSTGSNEQTGDNRSETEREKEKTFDNEKTTWI